MQLRTLREGSHNHDGLVLAFEEFLRDENFYWVEVDGDFNGDTDEAVRIFQKENGLKIDGVVGGKTWGAALGKGFHAVELEPGDDWPARPGYMPIPYNERAEVFGHITYHRVPVKGNPEAVKITNNWEAEHLVTADVPQLKGIPGIIWSGARVGKGPSSGRIRMHKLAVEPTQALWQAWEDAGLLGKIETWLGMLCIRFVRGSRSSLSNHARGTAFDINAGWNGLRKTPALKGQRGCVRELVEVAMNVEVDGWRWWWGGWGMNPPHYTKLDGMHFELTLSEGRP